VFHLDRARAESFGSAADAYERHRPEFPAALIDELPRLGRDALDLASGTGKVAHALSRRGVRVLGVEIDAEMARVARARGLAIEVAKFETWDPAGRTFDLVTCGDAWHWLEPEAATAQVARVLRPGGALVRFFNLQVLDDAVLAALAPVYREHAPEVYVYGQQPDLDGVDVLPLTGPFTPHEMRMYRWERHVTPDEWAAFTGTISDHRRLPAAQLAALQAAIRDTLRGAIDVRGTTYASFARRE
jgi:SAM-dependent methyltransferase